MGSLPIPSPSPPSSPELADRRDEPPARPFVTELERLEPLTSKELDATLQDTLENDLLKARSERKHTRGVVTEAAAWAALVTPEHPRLKVELNIPMLIPCVPGIPPPLLPALIVDAVVLCPVELPWFGNSLLKATGQAVYSQSWLTKRKEQWRARRNLTTGRSKKPISTSLLTGVSDSDRGDENSRYSDASYDCFGEALAAIGGTVGVGKINTRPITTEGETMATKQRRIQNADGFLHECLRRCVEEDVMTADTDGASAGLSPSAIAIGKRYGQLMDEEAVRFDEQDSRKSMLSLLPPLPYIESEKPGSIVFRSSLSKLLPSALDLSNPSAPAQDTASAELVISDALIADLVRTPGFFALEGVKDADISARALAVANSYPWQTEISDEDVEGYGMSAARSFIKYANAVNFKANNVRDVMTGAAASKGYGRIEYKGLLSGSDVDAGIYAKRYEQTFVALNKKLVGGIGSSLGVVGGVTLSLTESLFAEGFVTKNIFRKPRDPLAYYSATDGCILDTIASRGTKKIRRKMEKMELSAAIREAAALSEQVIKDRAAFARQAKAASKAAKKKRKAESKDARAVLKKLKQAKEQLMQADGGGGGRQEVEPNSPINKRAPTTMSKKQVAKPSRSFARTDQKKRIEQPQPAAARAARKESVTNEVATAPKRKRKVDSLLQDRFFSLHSKNKRTKQVYKKKASEIEMAMVEDYKGEKEDLEVDVVPEERAAAAAAAELAEVAAASLLIVPKMPRLGLVSSSFVTEYTSSLSELSQKFNINLSDSEWLDDFEGSSVIVEMTVEAAIFVVNPRKVSVKDATKAFIALRTTRRFARLDVLVVCKDKEWIKENTEELTHLHNSIGDSRNGDFVSVSYTDEKNLAKAVYGIWRTADGDGGEGNAFLKKFDPSEWSKHDFVEFLQGLAPSLSVMGAMRVLEDWRGGEMEEVCLEKVWAGIRKPFEGVMQEKEEEGVGGRLIGMAHAMKTLRNTDWR
jgi:hypothetical protein